MAQEEFLDDPMPDVIEQWRYYFSLLLPQADDLILDVGCNTAEAERLLLREYPKIGKVIGLENDPKRCDYASAKLQIDGNPAQIELKRGDALELPFPDSHFDRAFCVDVLEWVDEPVKALQEIHRVLKPAAQLSSFIQILIPRYFAVTTKNSAEGSCTPSPTAAPTANSGGNFIDCVASLVSIRFGP